MTQLSVFESRTPEVIKAEILTALTASGVEIDTREGSYTNTSVRSPMLFGSTPSSCPASCLSCSLARTAESTWTCIRPNWAWCASPAPRPG